MGWLRITFPDDAPVPAWAQEMNAEADQLDPLSEGYIATTRQHGFHRAQQRADRPEKK